MELIAIDLMQLIPIDLVKLITVDLMELIPINLMELIPINLMELITIDLIDVGAQPRLQLQQRRRVLPPDRTGRRKTRKSRSVNSRMDICCF